MQFSDGKPAASLERSAPPDASASTESKQLPRTLAEALAMFSPGPPTEAAMPPRQRSGFLGGDAGDSEDGELFCLPTGSGKPWRVLVGGMSQPSVTVFTRMLAWLLKHSLIREVHTYIYMLWPWHYAQSTSTADSEGEAGRTGTAGDSPSWSAEELDYLHILEEGQPTHAVTLLRRLVSYLRDVTSMGRASGQSGAGVTGASTSFRHCISGVGSGMMLPVLQLNLRLDDVIWRLHTTRQEVLEVVALYPDLFVISIHE